MTIVEMRVHMDCGGCETKIKKALKKLEGVDEVYIDIELQKVTVMGWADQKKILKTVKKTGRRAELWPYPYYSSSSTDYQSFTQQHYSYHQQQHPITNYTFQQPPPSSSYSYYSRKHHGGSSDFDYYQQQQSPYSHVFGERTAGMSGDENPHARYEVRTGDIFSDENPHACSIM